MKKQTMSLALLIFLAGCSSAPTINGMKKNSEEDKAKAYQAGKDGDVKYLFNEFRDSYKGENKIKKIGILYYSIGWDKSQELRNKSGASIDPGYFPNEYQALVDASMEEMKETFKKLGYEVLTPAQLAEKSETFRSIKSTPQFFEYSPTSGQEYVGMAVPDSRYIHIMTHEGKLLSKINSEVPEVDAFIGFSMNSHGTNGSEWLLDRTTFYGVTANHSIHSFFCVPREKAKKAGVSLGWFGDANDCARGNAEFKSTYYLPGQNTKGKPVHDEIKNLTFENLKQLYKRVNQGLVENYYQQGLKK